MHLEMVEAYRVGEVIGYLARFKVAVVKVELPLRVGDRIQLIGFLTDFRQTVESIEVHREHVDKANAGDAASIPVDGRVRAGDAVVLLPTEGRGRRAACSKRGGVSVSAQEIEGRKVGEVAHYFGKISVAAIKLEDGLRVGAEIRIVGHTTDFTQMVESMQIENEPVDEAGAGDEIGIKVIDRVRGGDEVYVV